MIRWSRSIILVLLLLLTACPGMAQQEGMRAGEELAHLDLEQLLDVEIESTPTRPTTATLSAAAITKLSADDIRRSGAATLPDALKHIPALHVRKVDTDAWVVGMRGFSGLRNSTVLVLVDGRPVTSASLAGVYWSALNIPLSTVESIEVIRGPGTSLWGLDSFNGVVKVTTKRAEDTQTNTSTTTVGTTLVSQELLAGTAIGEDGHARASTSLSYADGQEFDGRRTARYWTRQNTSMRLDQPLGSTSELSVLGGLTLSSITKSATPPHLGDMSDNHSSYTGYMQFMWDKATGLNTGLHARTSYTRSRESIGDMAGVVNVVDLETQASMRMAGIHHLSFGVGGRAIWDQFENGESIQVNKNSTVRFEGSGFLQDRIHLRPEGLDLTLGLKLDAVGDNLEYQPTARLLYDMGSQVWWAAVSYAERSADRLGRQMDLEIQHNGQTYTMADGELTGSEQLTAWELGWRFDTKQFGVDVALFLHDYDKLMGAGIDTAANQITLNNDMEGTTTGAEIALSWQATDTLRISPSLNWLYHSWENAWMDPKSGTFIPEGNSWTPKLHLYWDLTTALFFHAGLYQEFNIPDEGDSSTNLESTLSWQATDALCLELMGTNLFGSRDTYVGSREDPTATMRITWTF